MSVNLREATKMWACDNAAAVRQVSTLVEAGLNPLIFCSVAAAIGERALRISQPRGRQLGRLPKIGDVDFQIAEDQFDEAVRLTNAKVVCRPIEQINGRGEPMNVLVEEACAGLLQFMRPLGLMMVGDVAYDTRLTPEAVEAGRVFDTNAGYVPLAHPAETRWAYYTRCLDEYDKEGGKRDSARLAVVEATADPYYLPTHYEVRATQIGGDEAFQRFMSSAIAAVQEREQLAVAA